MRITSHNSMAKWYDNFIFLKMGYPPWACNATTKLKATYIIFLTTYFLRTQRFLNKPPYIEPVLSALQNKECRRQIKLALFIVLFIPGPDGPWHYVSECSGFREKSKPLPLASLFSGWLSCLAFFPSHGLRPEPSRHHLARIVRQQAFCLIIWS